MSRLLFALALLLPGLAVAQEAPPEEPTADAPQKDTGGAGLRFGLGDGEEEVIDPELLAMDTQTLETEARAKFYESQLLTARRYADELLRRDPDSIVGHFVVGNAYREAEKVRGQGDAEANRVYGEAFGKDPQFAEFYRSLDAYKASIGHKGDVLVLDPQSSDFFRNMRGAPTRR